MCEPGAVVIALRRKKYLRLMFQTPKSLAVQNAIPISLVNRTEIILRLLTIPPVGIAAQSCTGREKGTLGFFQFFSYAHIVLHLNLQKYTAMTVLPSRCRSMGFVVKTPFAQAHGVFPRYFTISLPLDGFSRQNSSCASAWSLSSLFYHKNGVTAITALCHGRSHSYRLKTEAHGLG